VGNKDAVMGKNLVKSDRPMVLFVGRSAAITSGRHEQLLFLVSRRKRKAMPVNVGRDFIRSQAFKNS